MVALGVKLSQWSTTQMVKDDENGEFLTREVASDTLRAFVSHIGGVE